MVDHLNAFQFCELSLMYDLFYKNRRLLMLAIALIVVTGLSSVYVLPRLEDPVLKQRAALIHTSFPGANAVRVETLVTEPMEDTLKEIEEIRFIRSASRDEMSTITLELKDYVDEVEPVWSRVRDKLADVEPLLPAGADKPHFVDLRFITFFFRQCPLSQHTSSVTNEMEVAIYRMGREFV